MTGQVPPYPDAAALCTGRACLAAMLRILRPRRVYVPFYTCNAVYQPFVEAGVVVAFYALDEAFLPVDPPVLRDGEYFLYTNYFGLCEDRVHALSARYGNRLLVDDTHAFFSGRHAGLWSFNSARKFFDVPDGAFLFAPTEVRIDAPRFVGASTRHLALRAQGRFAAALAGEAAYERTLNASIRRIGKTSEDLLRGCDFARAARIRRENFIALHAALGEKNRLKLPLGADAVPFCYPFLPIRAANRAALLRMGIFPTPLWPDVSIRAVDGYAWERHLSRILLALPIDRPFGPGGAVKCAAAIVARMPS